MKRDHARIAVPVCASHADELPSMVERAAASADVIELRLDFLHEDQLATALRRLHVILARHPQSFILTLRPLEQGGHRALTRERRVRFWNDVAESSLASSTEHEKLLFDIELELLRHAANALRSVDWERVICSFHDFDATPAHLDAVYEEMAATPAHILKIAVHAASITDCLAVFRLLSRAVVEGREIIAIAMGGAGTPTRILAPARGARLSFAALDEAQPSAPGQLSATALRRLYRIDSIGDETEIFGLMGQPVAHSVSPHMHNAAFDATATDAVYLPFEVRDADAFVRRMAHPRTRELDWNLRGLSITAPHKSAVMPHLDWVEQSAREIGAVNTIVIRDGELHGYNTDAAAALAPLENRCEFAGARVALIGAGGAARAALWSLRMKGAHATVFARDVARARDVGAEFGARVESLEAARFAGFDVVINATPLGTRGTHEEQTPAVAAQLRGARFVYDLVYNPSGTRLLREARIAGCETVGGMSMLVAQAAAQFKLWTARDAPLEAMLDAATRELARRTGPPDTPATQ